MEAVHPASVDLSGAVEQQNRALDARLARGESLMGYKVALTSKAAQARLGASGPVWGWLTDAMELCDGDALDCSSQLRTKAEAELVFVLGADLVGPRVNEVDVLRATAAIRPGIELPGSQLAVAPASVAEFVADNASAGRYVLGRPNTDFRELDLQLLGAVMERDGNVVFAGAGARVMDNPTRAVAWLANSLAATGRELNSGMCIFTGALTDPLDVRPGDSIAAEFGHLDRIGFKATGH